ncbi:MAG: dihydropteroate synthase [Planctomycetaceae bacterium]|nr:dihydropteroate synthase [Planctomycetaceae bacterium]
MSSIPIQIIGESLNDSVPSTHTLYENGDAAGIQELAKFQDEKGAAYIDVNVGGNSADFFVSTIRQVQEVVKKPLSIDTPDAALAEAGLKECSTEFGIPILNSISPLRMEMFQLYEIKKFRPILLISEHFADGQKKACHSVDETVAAAKFLLAEAKKAGIPNDDLIFDPGIAPIGTDMDGNLSRIIGAMERIHNSPEFDGVHFSVGLSNFTVMLPPKTKDGSPVKAPLESAFLTIAIPLGLDFIIGSVKRNYELLPAEHPAMLAISDCLQMSGIDSIQRIRKFYR